MADDHKQQGAAAVAPALTGPKRQHFLPRFYLEGFARDGLVSLYDREADEYRRQQPVNTGVIGHFYTMTDDQGRKRYDLERELSSVEAKAAGAIKKLLKRQTLTSEERSELAIFIALAGFRTPDAVDSVKHLNGQMISRLTKLMLSDLETVKDQLRGKPDAPSTEEELTQHAKAMIEFAQSDNYTVETDHQWAVGMAVSQAMAIAPILAGRDWLILHRDSERCSFVTTDSPVMLTTLAPRPAGFWSRGVGFANRDAMVAFPLTQSCAIHIFGNSGKEIHAEMDQNKIKELNTALAVGCQRFVIGRDEALVKAVVTRAGVPGTKWKPRMQMS